VIEKWDWVDKSISEELRAEADGMADYDTVLDISGYDIDGDMIEIAKANALEAGLADDITFKQLAAADWTTDKKNGIIVANPPYGERLGDEETVHKLYHEMGDVYRPLTTWSKYILTSDLEFETYYGNRATKKRKLYNGALRTDLFQFWGKKERRPRPEETTENN
jgi:putative N6-adenine-specific DNA methylase